MKNQEYCSLECGEEELEESQIMLHEKRLKTLDALIKSAEKCRASIEGDFGEDSGVVLVSESPPPGAATDPAKVSTSSPNSSGPVSSPSIKTSPPSKISVLDPSTLNRMVASNAATCTRVPPTNSFNITVRPTSSVTQAVHSLPPQIPLTHGSVIRICPSTPVNITGVVSNAPRLMIQPRPRMRFPVASPRTYPPCTPNNITVVPPQVQPPNVTFRIVPPFSSPLSPSNQTAPAVGSPRVIRTTLPVLSQPAGQYSAEPQSYNQTTTSPPTSTNLQTENITCLWSKNLPHTMKVFSKDGNCYNSVSVPKPRTDLGTSQPSAEVTSQCVPKTVLDNGAVSRSSDSPSFPLPLLPETRPETASDSRPRARPGPASRKRVRLPPDNLSEEKSSNNSVPNTVDLTQDEKTKILSTKDKTFPSLIVSARPSLKIIGAAVINNERLLMDNQIRKLMQMSPSAFTDYLLQKKLLKSEQYCREHKAPLKLAMYSEGGQFPTSGGYAWIAECCPTSACSVYSGSIFDKTSHHPTTIIKLMYHWACNTSVHNVLSWVKVDSYIMKHYYTCFRAVCISVVQQKFSLLGGSSKKIQVGVISIGTCPDGKTKEVKVDVMGVMDPDTNQIRLKVLEDFLSDSNKVYESKFRKILEVLREWVHPKSTIITDFAVDQTLCLEYGFSHLVVSGKSSANNNNAVMDYMRAKVPTMFQNTLGLLSYQIIQQFLDELVWRETWGQFPSRAYECLVRDIGEMTKLPGPDLIIKLKNIASAPNKDWKYSVWKDNGDQKIVSKAASSRGPANQLPEVKKTTEDAVPKKVNGLAETIVDSVTLPAVASANSGDKHNPVTTPNNDKICLEQYYYGVIEGNRSLLKSTGAFLIECGMCKRDLLSASSLTDHLIHHALNKTSAVTKLPLDKLFSVCKLCFKTVQDMTAHKEEKHSSVRNKFWCRICNLDLQTEAKIITHMTFVHKELDMPYRCDICHFQTSIYEHAVGHFKEHHNKDSRVQCPYCLKTVRICTKNGVEITKHQLYFVQHIQRHSIIKLNRKCEKCLLSFTNMATLKRHQEKMHKRPGTVLANVKRMKMLDQSKMVMMDFPKDDPLPPVTLHESNFHTLKGKALSSTVIVPEYYSVCSCVECDGPLAQNHFSVKMTCTRCNFQSCCANSIREHSARRHHLVDNPDDQCPRTQVLGGSPFMKAPLYCTLCTHFSSNGDKMASHLLSCGKGAAATVEKRRLDENPSSNKFLRTA